MPVCALLLLMIAGSAAIPSAPHTQAGVTALTEGSDWPRFLGPTDDGKSPETGILTDWGESGPPLVWEHVAGEGYPGAVVAAGRLFFFDHHDGQNRLVCLDPETGAEVWRSEHPSFYRDFYGYNRGPRTAPVVDGERVFTFGVEGTLRAHHVTDGRTLWEVDTAERFGMVQNFFGAGSSPIVEGDLLIAMVGGSPPGSPDAHSGQVVGNGTGIVAFDKATGEIHYTISDELASYASPVIRTIAGRRWGLVFARGGLVGFNPTDGTIDFHFPWRTRQLQSVNASNPVVVDDTVFITEAYGRGGALLRVEPGGYEVIWQDGRRDQSLATHFGNVIYHDGILYGSHGRHEGPAELRAVDHANGEIRWRVRGVLWTSLLYVDGHLIVLSSDGSLHLVEATPEAVRAKASVKPARADGTALLRTPAWSPPVLSHGLLYLRGRDRLIALELIPGRSRRPFDS